MNYKLHPYLGISFLLATTILILVMFGILERKEDSKYPKYSITTVQYVPDSLKSEYTAWIQENVRARKNKMGSVKDMESTHYAMVRAAKVLYAHKVLGLRITTNDAAYSSVSKVPWEMNQKEKAIFDSLLTVSE